MKSYKKASLVAAAVALTVAPVMASAAQSANGPVVAQYDEARIDAQTSDENELEGRGSSIIIAILAAAAIIAGIIIAADGSDDTPTSP